MTLENAFAASAKVIDHCGEVKTGLISSEKIKHENNPLLNPLNYKFDNHRYMSELDLLGSSRNNISLLIDLLRKSTAFLSQEGMLSQNLNDAINAKLQLDQFSSCSSVVSTLHNIIDLLRLAVQEDSIRESPSRLILLILEAVVDVSIYLLRHFASGSTNLIFQSQLAFANFSDNVIMKLAYQISTLETALCIASLGGLSNYEVLAGLVLGFLPIDYSDSTEVLRVDVNFCVVPELTISHSFVSSGLSRRTLHIILTGEITLPLRVSLIAALSSFTSRSYLFINLEGSEALNSRVGFINIKDFPLVDVANIDDLYTLKDLRQ